jgi:hypothetical protein
MLTVSVIPAHIAQLIDFLLELNVGSDGLGVTLAVTCDDSKWHVVTPRSSKRVSRMSKRNLLIRQ